MLDLRDAGVPLADLGEVEVEVRLQAHLPAALAQLRQALADEVQPGAVVGQLEGLAGAFRQRLAAAQGDGESQLDELLAPGRLAFQVAEDAQAPAAIEVDQQLARAATEGQVALVVEGQRGAVLGLFEHAPLRAS